MDPPEGKQMPLEQQQPRMRLVQARVQLKLSQRQVAERIGTTFVNVSRWERGITKPSPYFRRRLVQLYGRTEEELDLAQSSDTLPPLAPPTSLTSHLPVPSPTSTASPEIISPVTSIVPVIDPTIPLPPINPLVGRDDVLAKLKQRLRTGGNVTLTALNGLPGVGKTTLAITIAHDTEMRAHFRDGVLWAGLGPQPNLSGMAGHWGGLLGISQVETGALNDAEAWAVALRRAIGSRHMLLVIDDAWTLQAALALKVGGPNCAHLITTRYPSIASQLGTDSAMTIRELGEDESVMLLRILAPQLMDNETQTKRAHELALAVGGLPLALTLAGNYLRRQAFSGQPRRVEAALNHLSNAVERLRISEPHNPAERHPSLPLDTPVSLQSVIAVTDALLNADQQAALRALSVFPPKPDNFSEEAALHIASCSTDTLDALVDAGLLEWSEHGRFTMHQTIADYARSRLDSDTPAARLADYMADFVFDYRKDYALLEQESNCILAALEAAHALDKSKALMRCIYAYIPYLRSRGQYSLAEKHLHRAYDAANHDNDAHGKAGALLYLGEIAQKQGNYELATSSLQEGLALARQVGEKGRITALLADLGWVTWKRGEYAQAERYLQEGLELARQIDDKEHISDILETLGSVAASRGEYNSSMKYAEEALEMAREIGDQEKICTLLINLGVTEGDRGNYEQAGEYSLEGLKFARQIGHREWISLLLTNLGHVASEQGDYNGAKSYFLEGLELARLIENREWISALLNNLGRVYQMQGDTIQAEDFFQESIRIARTIGRPTLVAVGLYEFGNLHLNQQRINAAEQNFLEIFTIISPEDHELHAIADFGLARVALASGRIEDARNIGEESASRLESIGNHKAQEVRNWLNLIIYENIEVTGSGET